MKQHFGLNPGDSIGNRRLNKEIRIPSDDIGNYLAMAQNIDHVPDHIGNSIDSAPTHLLSGLTHRKKSDSAPHVRIGRYLVGGVNPLVAGLVLPESQNPENKSDSTLNSADRRLQRLFELDNDKGEYPLSSTPEEKRALAEQVIQKIFEAANLIEAQSQVRLEQTDNKTAVVVSIKTPVFKTGELPLIALNFLVNKLVNKLPTDRIRLMVRVED